MQVATVNTDLRSLVFGKPSQGLFSFGEPTVVTKSEEPKPEIIEKNDVFEDLNTQKFFFFHFKNPSKRVNVQDPQPFVRSKSVEEIQRDWENSREQLTEDFKRKHKDSFKRQKKMKAN